MVVNRPDEDVQALKRVLIPVAKAIATTIGPRCEVVLHDLRKLTDDGSTIVWIENGHVTGRTIGGPTTNLGLQAIHGRTTNPDRYDYKSTLSDGRVLRSSSVYFHDSNGQLIFALCINLDVTDFMTAHKALETLIGSITDASSSASSSTEIFGTTIDSVLSGIIRSAEATMGTNVKSLGRAGRVEFVKLLDDNGAFEIKRAVNIVSNYLGVSRATIYAYLEQARRPFDGGGGSSQIVAESQTHTTISESSR